MTPYRIYKHKNCIDVAIVPLKAFYVKEKKYWKIKVRWIIYKNDGKIQEDLKITQHIQLSVDSLKDWQYKDRPSIFIS